MMPLIGPISNRFLDGGKKGLVVRLNRKAYTTIGFVRSDWFEYIAIYASSTPSASAAELKCGGGSGSGGDTARRSRIYAIVEASVPVHGFARSALLRPHIFAIVGRSSSPPMRVAKSTTSIDVLDDRVHSAGNCV